MGFLSVILNNYKNMKKAAKLRAMSEAEWLRLDDEAFFDALIDVCEDAVYDINAKDITDEQKTVYSLINFEIEVNNGGLCQFFVNSSRECAPYVSIALDTIGCTDLKEIYDKFINENNIDVNNLNSFIISDVSDYEKQTERFDFDSFDDEFYENETLHGLIINYAKKNLNSILKP